MMPAAVELSVLSGVGGCGNPISARHVRMGAATWPLWKRAPSSASAADAMTLRSVRHSAWRGPFGVVVTGDFAGLEG